MKKLIGIISGVVILGLLGFGIYKIFIDCERTNTTYDKYFTLNEMDYAVIDDELNVKVLDIKDNRCKGDDCEREGQYLVRLLVYNDAKIAYVELGTLDPLSVNIDKLSLEYTVNLIRVDEKGATLTVNPTVKE